MLCGGMLYILSSTDGYLQGLSAYTSLAFTVLPCTSSSTHACSQ